MPSLRHSLIAAAVGMAMLTLTPPASAAPDPGAEPSGSPQVPVPDGAGAPGAPSGPIGGLLPDVTGSTPDDGAVKPEAGPDHNDPSGPDETSDAGRNPFGPGQTAPGAGKASSIAEQAAHAQAEAAARAKAEEAARAKVAEARLTLEKVRAKHRLQQAQIARLLAKADKAADKAEEARREMGNLARAAYSAGDEDLNLLATLLEAQTPQDVLSGAGTAARIAGYREDRWTQQSEKRDDAERLATAARELLDRSAQRLQQAKDDLDHAIELADAVKVIIAAPRRVPPVDLLTKSDWVFPTATGQIDSEAGMRMHPILRYVRCHAGADISAPAGTPIFAVDDGVVVSAGVNGGYGNFTLVAHGNGLTSGYAHQQLILVKAGDIVTRGQLIGEVGSTGLSTGAHLHFEASYHGVPYNPRGWLEDKPQLRVSVCG